jgi:hypothetical protein
VAVGKPETVIRARAVQLVVLVAGILALGPRYHIEGVALAVDLMLLVGIGILLWQARDEVDFSVARLFVVPLAALIIALAAGALSVQWVSGAAWWLEGGLKALLFSIVYAGVLLLRESRELIELGRLITARRQP